MKYFRALMILAVVAVLVDWIRRSYDFPLHEMLPFVGRPRPGLYNLAGLALIAIALAGAIRLLRRGVAPPAPRTPARPPVRVIRMGGNVPEHGRNRGVIVRAPRSNYYVDQPEERQR